MGQRPLGRFISLFLLIAACAVVALIAGQLLFPGNLKPIILGWVILSLFVLLIPFLSWYLEARRETTPRKDVISLFVSIASSLILIGSLGLAWLSLDNTQQQTKKTLELSLTTLENTRAEQRSRRFMEALEKLGGETPHKRLAGVHAFQKLDEEFKSEDEFLKTLKESEANETLYERDELLEKRQGELKEHWAIMEILTNFVRSQVSWPNAPTPAAPQLPRDDVLQILKYLGQRKLTLDRGERKVLDLSKTDLRGYILNKTLSNNCDPADSEVDFEHVDFSEANLENMELRCVKLKGATFWNARLQNARLDNTDLTGVDFTGAHLEGAWLDNTVLTDVAFTGAHLEGASMKNVTLSHDETLESAFTNKTTVCPPGFDNETKTPGSKVDDPESGKCVKTQTLLSPQPGSTASGAKLTLPPRGAQLMYGGKLLPSLVVISLLGIGASVALPRDRVSTNGAHPQLLGVNLEVSSVVQKDRLFDRFKDAPLKDERVRLDNFADQLQREPNAMGYVVVYSKRGRSKEAKKRADRAKNYLLYQRYTKNRIESLDHCVRPALEFELWIVESGSYTCKSDKKPRPTK